MAWTDTSRIRRLTAIAMVVLGISTYFAQQLSSADPADAETVQLVAKHIQRLHLSRKKIDDQTSAAFLDRFLKNIDPDKIYFLQSDVDSFMSRRYSLDDEIKRGDVSFAYTVFERYKERLRRQLEVAHYWVDQEHDFSLDESIETDEDKLTWAKTTEELDDRWRRRIKHDLLQFKIIAQENEGETESSDEQLDPKERLHKRYRNSLLAANQFGNVEQLERYLTALVTVFDPHSEYMSPQSWEDFEIDLRLSLDGIGALLQADDGYTVVAKIVPGGAAAQDGRLAVKDKIIGVGQEEGEIVDIYEMKLTDVVRMIRGPRGTIVRLQVKTAEDGKTEVYALTRQKIELKESEVKGEIIETQDRIGRPGSVGVISIPTFYRDFAGASAGLQDFKSAAADVEKVLASFARDPVDVVIIDLRYNGGGALTEAVEVSGHFIDRGPVVQVKEPSGYKKVMEDEDSGVSYNGPLIVICNRLSASASEIFAGVIKDYRRGIVIGDSTTHGKGTVQTLMDVAPREPFRLTRPEDRGKLKLTIQQFYRVNGDSTQNRGVRSDIVLPSLMDHWDLGESFLDNALPFDKIQPAPYKTERSVNQPLISALRENSKTRVSRDDDFQRVERSIARYLEKKSKTKVSLNEDEVRREREADKAASKSENPDEDKSDEAEIDEDEKPVFPDNYYNNEALNIALDYVDALRGNLTVAN